MGKVNRAQIEQLRFFEMTAEEKLIDNLIRLFDEQIFELVPKMRALQAEGQGNELSKYAHMLKSSAGQLGLIEVEQKCLELETEGRRKTNYDFSKGLDELENQTKESMIELRALLSTTDSVPRLNS